MYRVDKVCRGFSRVHDRGQSHSLEKLVPNSSDIILCTTRSMSRGWGFPVQLYTAVSSIMSYAAWHAYHQLPPVHPRQNWQKQESEAESKSTCNTLRARRISPLDSFNNAAFPSSVRLHLDCQLNTLLGRWSKPNIRSSERNVPFLLDYLIHLALHLLLR
jgi:hypothetical protein